MTRPVDQAVVRTGVVSKEALRELLRWGAPIEDLIDEPVVKAQSLQEIVDIIRDALDQHDQTSIRESDLEIVRFWLRPENQRDGKLQLPVDEKTTSFKVVFCRTILGEFIIPWGSEGISDLLLDAEALLTYEEDGVKKKVHFIDYRELFVGDHKAFVVCTGEKE